MQDQRAGIADVGEMADDLDALDKRHAGLESTLQPEGEDRARAPGQIFLRQRPVGAGLQAGMGNPAHGGMLFKPLGHRQRIDDLALHAQREGLDSQQRQPGIEGCLAGAEVAQGHRMAVDGEGEVAETFGESQAVITRLRLRQAGELVVLQPVELAGIDYHATHRRAVARQELGRGMDHQIGAELDRPAQVRCGQGIVHDQRYARFMGDGRDGFDIDHHAAGIGQVLQEDRLGPRSDSLAEVLGIVGIDEGRVPAEFLDGVAKLVDRSAVKLVGSDEIVARPHQRKQRQNLRGMAR